MGIKYKIIQFNINEFGVDIESIQNELSFENLAWDTNDIKLSQLRFLISKCFENRKIIIQEAQRYLDDNLPPKGIQALISTLSVPDKKTFHAYKAFRKRGICQFVVEYIDNKWAVNNIDLPALTNFTQHADHQLDLRQLIRRFPPMDRAVIESPTLRILIKNFVEMLCECEPKRELKKIEVTCHQVSLIIDSSIHSVSNSPEGLHQDGSNYIVSALVIDKYNIEGGESKLYCTEKDEFIKSHTLEPGEGLFHIDKGSTIWHQVTPIKLKKPSMEIGYRNILGFDFNYIL
ncbi:2OG-Fe dioxygenase family protein [Yersinia kristensenii]|uniref:2OG-Fe dioxygenase family protein n=1 Tax=Yersinia kristensenii TaxID=28152 RepID=UPI001C61011E|nr:2OG-Fe dioxygenase family protein [Yersinia kristensenii]MBW5811466.1 2OG-Fe dioxygenase family protein [Yersinia kristensenii]MBW5815208.1 2OG-Fe dioxygenase family protein [Yersinia kristensenii]MBW5828728.1 2OG-Fe dioxygenase family protein [Yersinia kristensenii]MBW5841116.1 2OG-Fe dioxygenase family protein [Yersinia kristensenii]